MAQNEFTGFDDDDATDKESKGVDFIGLAIAGAILTAFILILVNWA